MEESLKYLKDKSFEIREEGRLSTLVHEHIDVLDHYSFTLPDSVIKEELRPLNKMHEYIEKKFII